MNIPRLSIERPVAVSMAFLCIVLIGIISLIKLPVELMPNISFGQISIVINVRGGIPPQEVEERITKPVEEAVSTVSNLKSVVSSSKEGESTVVLLFEPGTDMDFAALEVREKFAKVKNKLPQEVERPVIAKYQYSDLPIMIIAATSKLRTQEDLRRIIEKELKDPIKRIEGVANIEVVGGRERKVLVEADPVKLVSYKVSLDDIISAINQNNLSLLAGDVSKGDKNYSIRALGQFESVDEVRQIPIISSKGAVVRLKDIAEVSDSYLEPRGYSRVNITPAVSVYIQKESTANTVSVSRKILKEFKRIKKALPKDIESAVVSNHAKFINAAITNVETSLLFGALLAIAVLFLFLKDIRAILTIALSIPISLAFTISLIYFQKISLNVMTLSGLALGVGMLVDSSIVVIENIFKKKEMLQNQIQGAEEGTNEVALAIAASTITTIVVFLPIVFMSKELRLLYGGLSLTVSYALISSLFVALSLVPMLQVKLPQKRSACLEALRENILGSAKKLYIKHFKKEPSYPELKRNMRLLLKRVIRNRLRVAGFLLGGFLIAALVFSRMGTEFAGALESNEFTAFIELPTGTSLELANKAVSAVEVTLKSFREVEDYFSARVEPRSSKVYVTLKSASRRHKPVEKIMDELRDKVKKLTSAFIYFERPQSQASHELTLDIFGDDYTVLRGIASQIASELSHQKTFKDIKLRLREGRPEIDIVLDKEKAGRFNLTTNDVAMSVHAQMRGMRATLYREKGEEIETIVRLKPATRLSFDDIRRLPIFTRGRDALYLNNIASFKRSLAPSEIWHKDRSRVIQLSADIGSCSLSKAAKLVEGRLKNLKLPEGYYYAFGGDYQKAISTSRELTFALIVTVLLIYLVLAAMFESFVQPFIIMVTVPIAFIGAIAVLFVLNKPIGTGVLMGLMMLGGIVVNNGIIMVDHINNLRKEGISKFKALFLSIDGRLRPILMTVSTTILGLVPMAISPQEGSSLWSPFAITVIAGLAFSTVLTLFVLPAVYLIAEDAAKISRKNA